LVVVEHEDGETLTRFASDVTLTPDGARDIAAIGMPTGAASRPD
jgi:hypothetical protein